MDVILCLGGEESRLLKGIELAKQYPNAKLVISSFSIKRSVLNKQLLEAGLQNNQFVLDYNALDTIGNFVDTLPLVRPLKPRKLYIVTSDYHMKRSRVIADIVYFGLGYELIACPCATNKPQEPDSLINTERAQALFWKATGIIIRDKATLNRKKLFVELSNS